MKLVNSSKINVDKSKFFGYLFKLNYVEDIKKVLGEVKNEHKKFSHICYSINFPENKIFKNDGEVGQPGKILLSLLERKNLEKHCLIVLRIFGGIKLGPAKVGKAFREVGENCLD